MKYCTSLNMIWLADFMLSSMMSENLDKALIINIESNPAVFKNSVLFFGSWLQFYPILRILTFEQLSKWFQRFFSGGQCKKLQLSTCFRFYPPHLLLYCVTLLRAFCAFLKNKISLHHHLCWFQYAIVSLLINFAQYRNAPTCECCWRNPGCTEELIANLLSAVPFLTPDDLVTVKQCKTWSDSL